MRVDKKFLSHTCRIDRPTGCRGVHCLLRGGIEDSSLSLFLLQLIGLLFVLAPAAVLSRPVFTLLICNFITRSLSELWQPLSKVPVLKTKLKLNLRLGSKQKISQLQLNVVLGKQVTDKHHRVNPRQIRNWTILIPGQEGKKTDYYDCSKLNLEELCVVIHAKAYRRRNGFYIYIWVNFEFSPILVMISETKQAIFIFSQKFRISFHDILHWKDAELRKIVFAMEWIPK